MLGALKPGALEVGLGLIERVADALERIADSLEEIHQLPSTEGVRPLEFDEPAFDYVERPQGRG